MILIIEDNPNIRQELSVYLQANGYPCICPECRCCTQDETNGGCKEPAALISHWAYSSGYQSGRLWRPGAMPRYSRADKCTCHLCYRAHPRWRWTGRNSHGRWWLIRKPYHLPILLARIGRIMARRNTALSESICASGAALNVLMGQITYQGQTLDLSKNESRSSTISF